MADAAAPQARSVLIVSYEYPPLGGGGGVIIEALAEELAKQIEVTVLTSGRGGLAETEKKGRLEIVRVPVWMRNADATASLFSMLSFFPLSLRRGAALLRSRRLISSTARSRSLPARAVCCSPGALGFRTCSRFREATSTIPASADHPIGFLASATPCDGGGSGE